MKISIIDAGNFKLDGGAMFGVVPKTIWQKMVPADENNLCSWKMRCLMVEEKDRLVLIDTGMGDKQAQKWQNFYFRHGDGEIIKSIRDAGYHENEVTDVLLSHLHFDHCGGAVCWNSSKDAYRLTFPNAKYWTHSLHWESAMKPNPREKATFLTENLQTIIESGQLNFIEQIQNPLGDKFEFIYADGHTEKMIMPIINYTDQKIIFAADTIPSFAHIHVPYCMSYDVRPLQTMNEKSLILDRIVKENILLLFDHDVVNEVAEIEITDRGFKAKNLGKLYEFI
ncbi:MBL fold metallo-hydrolase [Lacihabitans sp. CS3-21]|uniref:MBL fold metallo-hydrolase n=1 Tax=Lacihabitans sp. CS3-21 TaxID=2487332 RepID=UPI0020CB8F92|nr:MBL fold metallo-hydrolase [Lacihabitans sp. CS3-21]MCP9748382.1 MBL fold metallo-hydrolase [Lacihabitans sp. CS3-21]